MKNPILRLSLTSAAIAVALCGPVAAEDIDLFSGSPGKGVNPNVVIMIDNSANWEAASQHWPGNVKQGQSELRALARAVGELPVVDGNGTVNMGLMLFTPGVGVTPDGAYVRFHIREMNPANKLFLQQQIGIGTDAAGKAVDICDNGLNGLTNSPNCIFQNFSSANEKVGTAKLNYSAGLFEVFKYFGGFTDPAHALNDSPNGPSGFSGSTPIDASHFGPLRYARNGAEAAPYSDPYAYNGGSLTGYNPPFDADGKNSCAKNYLIFIGNGFPSQDTPTSLLAGVNGKTTQLPMPQFTTTVQKNVSTNLAIDTACHTKAACIALAGATFSGYDSFDCTGGVPSPVNPLGTDPVCETPAQCAVTASLTVPGYTNYTCTGGTTAAPTSGTDKACETQASCAGTTAPAMFPGYLSYACTGGSTTTGTVNLGTDPATESVAACKLRAKALYPGWTSYNCTGGTTVATVINNVGTDSVCENAANCTSNAPTYFPGHDSYVCSGGTGCGGIKLVGQTVAATDTNKSGMTMTATGCSGTGKLYNQTVNASNACTSGQTMQGTNNCITGQQMVGLRDVTTVVPLDSTALPDSSKQRYTDEWARYLSTTDANFVKGQQFIYTYTIDVFKDAQDADETALLMSMAKYGGGGGDRHYFQASNEDAILDALRQILTDVQAVNTVFASASLPINATNRSQNENQVFIGMFRPDGSGNPKWYGNLKQYQVALFGGDARLADALGNEAIASTTGFIQACANSFYTTDSDVTTATGVTHYWEFSPISAGSCLAKPGSGFNDQPDGNVVEKGGAAEVLRRGNDPSVPNFVVNRTMITCEKAPCTGTTEFNKTSVPTSRTGAIDDIQNEHIIEFTKGVDWKDENTNNTDLTTIKETRPSMHGDIAHSRPLPVNFGGLRQVEVYYGSNDGAFHAMRGTDGKELWSFIAPEHHGKLKRLYDNVPVITSPNLLPGTISAPKDYFFDGSAGLYQNLNSSQVWIFPTMRRGGRMIYAFDISAAGSPLFKWSAGCPNMDNDTDCTSKMGEVGQTWSVPNAAFIAGYPISGADSGKKPVVIVGGGYDLCEDSDKAETTCTSLSKGHRVYVLDADTGNVLAELPTEGSVVADITLIDRDFDGKVDHGYAADTRGNLYRIDFVDPAGLTPREFKDWTITKIAKTSGAGRKFLFAPSALSSGQVAYLALGSGDRERPLIANYPYTTPVQNRFYMLIDKFQATGLPVDLDGSSLVDATTDPGCTDNADTSKLGWWMALEAGQGEQTVTSSVIFGGTIFFSTNRPVKIEENSCATNLGEARGYAVNLLNASGVVGTGGLCGGDRSGIFTGGGLPPSPVVGTVPVKLPDGTTKPISILIGGVKLDTGGSNTSSGIGAQEPPVPIKHIRSRVYWYKHGDK